jgi:hypothetical protein
MVGKPSGAIVQQLLQKIVIELVRDDMKAIGGGRERKSAPSEAIVQFGTGGLFGLKMMWVSARLSLSADEVNSLFQRLAMPGLKATLRSE